MRRIHPLLALTILLGIQAVALLILCVLIVMQALGAI